MEGLTPSLQKIFDEYTPGPIQDIQMDIEGPALAMLRLDQISSWATGNKYFKLKYTMARAIELGVKHMVSKGGMFSNHLAALAEACHTFHIPFTAVVRSYQPDEGNPSIKRWRSLGADVIYMKPDVYRLFDPSSSEQLYPDGLFIPEGGLSPEGIAGASEIIREVAGYEPTHVVVPGGTMGTFAGILSSASSDSRVIAVPAWKGCTTEYITHLLNDFNVIPRCKWEVWPDFHWGGFGRCPMPLEDFMREFHGSTGIPLDPVYTAKMMYAVKQKMDDGFFDSGDRIIAVHTGGLQGDDGPDYLRRKKSGS